MSSGLTSVFGRRREWTEAEVEAELSPPPPSAKTRPKNPGNEATVGLNIHPWDSTVNLSVHQPLYPPGRVIHIVRQYPKATDGSETVNKR